MNRLLIKPFLTVVFMLGCFLLAEAQQVIQPKQLNYGLRGILYKEEKSVDLSIHSNGFFIGMNFGKILTYYKTKYFHINAGILKHPKEYRQPVNFQNGATVIKTSSAFTYGKQNNLIILRAGVGEKRYFSEKAKRKGVAVGISYEIGGSLGLLKPYYLNLNRVEENGVTDFVSTERYSEDNADFFLDQNRILGSASFFKGMDEISIAPGVHAKAALHFSVGAFDQFVRALEVGLMVDGYFKRMPIMILENNTPIFINGYVTIQLGKRN